MSQEKESCSELRPATGVTCTFEKIGIRYFPICQFPIYGEKKYLPIQYVHRVWPGKMNLAYHELEAEGSLVQTVCDFCRAHKAFLIPKGPKMKFVSLDVVMELVKPTRNPRKKATRRRKRDVSPFPPEMSKEAPLKTEEIFLSESEEEEKTKEVSMSESEEEDKRLPPKKKARVKYTKPPPKTVETPKKPAPKTRKRMSELTRKNLEHREQKMKLLERMMNVIEEME